MIWPSSVRAVLTVLADEAWAALTRLSLLSACEVRDHHGPTAGLGLAATAAYVDTVTR